MNKQMELERFFEPAFVSSVGVPKLRELILNLAMQGKLTEQLPSDTPVEKLLANIKEERKQLIQSKKIRNQQSSKNKILNIPKPDCWAICSLPYIYYTIGSRENQIKASEYQKKGVYPVVSQGNELISGYCNNKERLLILDKPVVVFGDHTRNIKYIDFNFIIGADGVQILNPYCGINSKFLFYLVQNCKVENRGYARHFGKLNENIVILPPSEEQERIVEKLDQLMNRCDQLEEKLFKQKVIHDQLIHSVEHYLLHAENNEESQKSWCFMQDNLEMLYQTKESIERLRNTFLQLAVMGKLVPQDISDEPASELLLKIRREKERLIENKQLRRLKDLPEILPEEIPFEIPKIWKWGYVDDVSSVETGSTPSTANSDYYGGDIPWYNSSVTNELFTREPSSYITQKAIDETNCKIFPQGTLIVAMYGQGKTRGQVSEIVIPGATNQALAAIVFFESSIETKDYIKYYFLKIYDEIRKLASGGAQPNLNVGKVRSTLIPIPPLEEQQRIVKKLDQFMELCDQLQTSIQKRNQNKVELINSLLVSLS